MADPATAVAAATNAVANVQIVEWPQMLRFVFSMVFVLAMMGCLALILRMIRDRTPGGSTPKKNRKRLQVLETLVIDPRRRAVLLRRDDKEHLVILGHGTETVVETGIESADTNGE